MREILFRGKRIDDGEWVYGDLQTDVGSGRYWILPIYYNEDLVVPETIGQYTGLKDKNGVRIFKNIMTGEVET